MCGIIGIVGTEPVTGRLIESLKRLVSVRAPNKFIQRD